MAKMKKLLTIEDLVQFCQQNKLQTFSSIDTGFQIAVQIPATFEEQESIDDTLMFGKVKLFHTNRNRNNSSVTYDAAVKSLPTIKYKPLLANFWTDPDTGETDFTSHDMTIDDDGNIVYIERQIGCFTADEPTMEYDDKKDRYYVYANVAIPRHYTEATSIIERKQGTKVSVELLINAMQYNSNDKVLELTDIIVQGATCLGVNPNTGKQVSEGMEGARLDIADFSAQNNSMFNEKFEQELIEIREQLDELTARFNKNTTQEGGTGEVNRFEELLAQYGKTVEDVKFNYAEMSDEELEQAFAEAFADGEPASEGGSEGDNDDPEDGDGTGEGEPGEGSGEGTGEFEGGEPGEGDGDGEPANEGDGEPTGEFARFQNTESGMIVSYAISHEDIRSGLYTLLAQYEQTDNTWYWIDKVFDDHFVYSNWDGVIYGQKYAVENDNVSFVDERYSLYLEYLTDSEMAELNTMRSTYAELKQFKEDTLFAQAHAEKEAVLAKKQYSVLYEKDEQNQIKNKEFAALIENMDNYSVEELEKEAKVILADHITNGGTFAAMEDDANEEEHKVVNKKFAVNPVKKTVNSKYGSLKFN